MIARVAKCDAPHVPIFHTGSCAWQGATSHYYSRNAFATSVRNDYTHSCHCPYIVPSQPTLRPFDIAVALRLVLVPEDRYEPMAEALVTSTSAVHRSVARLQQAGLCRAGSRTVARPALREFLLHGARYAFPAVFGPERNGVPTGVAHPGVSRLLPDGADSKPLVWPSDAGTERGESLVPLFPGVPAVALRDARMHELLACVDVLRAGSARERRLVGEMLAERVLWNTLPGGAPAIRENE